MLRSISILCFAILFFGCKKTYTSPCVDSKINDFKKNTPCSKGSAVKQYTFQGSTVYAFEPGTCGNDMTTEVINEDCKTLGYLGGISGNTTINGEEFSKAKFEKVVWSN